jgi:hypothetical protein
VSESPEPAPGVPGWMRQPWPAIAVGAAALLLVGVAIAASILLPPGEPTTSTSSSSPSTPTPGSSDPATPTPTPGGEAGEPSPEETLEPIFGEPIADVVEPDGVADFGDDVTARLISVTPYTATGSQPGEVSGPAVEVTLELRNDTGSAISLDGVTVNVYYGDDEVPAAPIDSRGTPFSGSLAPGATATGSYGFSVPEGEDVIVTLSKSPGSPLVVFQ